MQLIELFDEITFFWFDCVLCLSLFIVYRRVLYRVSISYLFLICSFFALLFISKVGVQHSTKGGDLIV